MNTIRSLASPRATIPRVIVVVAMALAVIAGLLAMHTVSGVTHAVTSSPALAEHHAPAASWTPIDADAEHCPGDCAEPSRGPEHSMLTTACVLALLAATIIVFAPALLARLATAMAGAARFTGTPPTVPNARPPSLLVLSISRT